MKKLAILALIAVAAAPPVLGSDDVYEKRGSWAESMTAARERFARAGVTDPKQRGEVLEELARRFWNDFPETDWFMQDSPDRPSPDEANVPRYFAWYFAPPGDAGAERRFRERMEAMIRGAVEELGPSGAAFGKRLDALIERVAPAGDPAWLNLYVDACRVRRRQRLERAAELAPRFVFVKHFTMGGSHYAYTEGLSDAQNERHFVPGSALCLAEWDGRQFRVETLLDDPGGVIRDPDVSFDGRRVVFAWKKSDRQHDYNLFEMDLQTRRVRPITEGLGIADYEPCYLPDGDILFNSTRCMQIVDCWWTEVSNLYRCDPDGRFLRRLTFDQVHTNYPAVTEDGRVLYTRWEYNDRGQVYPQPLLEMNPDGTSQRDFYGGNSWFPTTILHARGVPGTEKVIAIATGHHSRQTGKLILIDPALGRQENEGAQLVAPARRTPAPRIDAYGQNGELFQYPYALSETEYLVSYHPVGWPWREGRVGPRFGIYFTTIDGRRERLVSDPALPCARPVPAGPRVGWRVRPSHVDYRMTEGTCYVQDVYAGPGLEGVPRGTVKTLRVVAIEYRAAGIGSNNNGGPAGGALISTPVAVGNGAWDPKVVLGDAEVHADGSAFFRVPARTPVYFQLLDADGRMVQSMRSWTTLQPGENASCVGCHEHKNSVPPADAPLGTALGRGPRPLRPFYGAPRGFSFPREVQPILDRRCAGCHDGSPEVPYDLTDAEVVDPTAKRRWSASYLALTHARPDRKDPPAAWRGDADHAMVNWISAQSIPPMLPPYSTGSARSRLIELLDAGHEGVELSREERDKLRAWIDLCVPYCGDYREAHAWNPAEVEKYDHFEAKRDRLAAEERANIEAMLQRQQEQGP
jgi:hypothetical protein